MSVTMSPQGLSRKRPAPGTSPVVHPQLGTIPNYAPNPGSQLSNDQFLQWGQNPAPNTVNQPSFPDPATAYNPAAFAPPQQDLPAPTATTSGQIARRPTPNQLVSRNRGYEQAPVPATDNSSGGAGGGPGESGAWGESLDQLYRRASVAQKDAQAKRKQIPPFVQKLRRYALGIFCFILFALLL